ncbi:hypothetical protein HMPREF0591_1102 [Mycobacterium parascrofulaceum ATCC BAA-614]|uniref:Uncharacterized protein n=1 Tax=Mycobacterium parascrofulaceum ATCC BAA-614 TaxID=525368 RepID=D5P4K8_9MYCO|nr:hypothetical protein HMPREF0591_1102 [Mycobacterium parascrofulaceum ATCC BAA-614]
MGHLFRTGAVKKMTASVELSVAKETSTMTLSIVRRDARADHSARRKNGCPARVCGR